MFDKLKTRLFKSDTYQAQEVPSFEESLIWEAAASSTFGVPSVKAAALPASHLSQVAWIAKAYGFQFSERSGHKGYILAGHVQGRACKFERGHPSRTYLRGMELRARCDADLPLDASFLVVNRKLRLDLYSDALSGFADSLYEPINADAFDEVLWMRLFNEVTIPRAAPHFLLDYSVLSEVEEHAKLICQPELVKLLTTWPKYNPNSPFVLMLSKGKIYMRMRFRDDTFVLEHAIQTFTTACNVAIDHATKLAR